VDVREMGALTGPPTPWRLPSPAWMAWVWAPRGRDVAAGFVLVFVLGDIFVGAVFMVAPFWAQSGGGSKDQFGGRVLRAGGRMKGEIQADAVT
jgi:hypothetical protein